MRRFFKRAVLAAAGFFIFFGGISYGAPDIPLLRDAKDPAERARVQALIEGARKENRLVWIGNMIEPQHVKQIMEGFKAYYGLPNLTYEYTYGQTSQTVARVEQMLQAGRPTPDIIWFVLWAWYRDMIGRGKLMRYDSPYYKEYTISHKAGNSVPGYFVSDSYSFHPMWNVAAMEKAGFKNFNPTAWEDFADPKFNKLMSLGNISRSHVFTTIALGLRKVLGDEWFKKMAKNKPALFVRSAQGRDWCASGEYPVDLFSHAKNAEEVTQSGVKVKLLYPKEGIVIMPFAPVITGPAANPSTAKLFIDYCRSPLGTQRIAETGVSLIYGRPGVKAPPNEFLPPAEQIKVIPMNWDEDDTEKAIKTMADFVTSIGLSY